MPVLATLKATKDQRAPAKFQCASKHSAHSGEDKF